MIVLDSHIWFWWINLEHQQLPPSLLAEIESAPRVGVSPVSCFELALYFALIENRSFPISKNSGSQFNRSIAVRRGRLRLPLPVQEWFALALAGSDVELLPLTPPIAARAVELTEIHRDPFDRIIIATALEMDGRLASVDGHFADYPELAGRLIV
jgi:PIN domain nuclease of toxin-antitoxin system